MFAGIIHGLGKVEKISAAKGNGKAAQMTVDLGRLARGLKIGDSVSINGACLTVVGIKNSKASFEMVGETMKKTALGSLTSGDKVNIEQSLRVGDTIDGHFVLGHVDGVGTIIEKQKQKKQTKLWIKIDKKLMKYVVPKGSVAIDGISLTVVDVMKDKISVALIPHTLTVTTLGIKNKSDKVNVEMDLLGKYARKVLTGKD
ncbi:MAG: riboflavin synthase [Candidatus Nitrosomirales archaeon]|jgi:riboflavin synthase